MQSRVVLNKEQKMILKFMESSIDKINTCLASILAIEHILIEKGLSGQEHKYAKYPLLSGGQLQRVAIARSLVADPEILLMDEPFGALDTNTRLQMQDLLCKIWTKMQTTIVFVTHDISEAVYLGDEIHILRSNPAKIVERIHVDLPLKRDRSLKRDRKFMDKVYEIEDAMVSIQNFVDEERKNGKKC